MPNGGRMGWLRGVFPGAERGSAADSRADGDCGKRPNWVWICDGDGVLWWAGSRSFCFAGITSCAEARAEKEARLSRQHALWHEGHSPEAPGIAQWCAGSAFLIAVLAAAGWLSGLRFLAGAWRGYVPISPSTVLAFLLLGSALFGEARWHWSKHRMGRRGIIIGSGIPTLLGLLVLIQFLTGFDSRIEWLLSRTNEVAGGIPLGRMSPVTAAAFIVEGAALLLLLAAPRRPVIATWAAILGLAGGVCGAVVSAGYAYGAPLLYGGTTIPVAMPTAWAFVFSGAAVVSLALPGVESLRGWIGNSTRGIVMRTFLPPMLLFLLIEEWFSATTENLLHPALLHSVTALAGCLLVVLITGWTSRRVGDALDRTGETLRSSEELFRLVFRNSAAGMVLVSPENRFLAVNGAFCKMLDYGESELIGRAFQEITHPDDHSRGADLSRQALAGGSDVFRLEKRYLRKDGGVAWGVVVSTLIRDRQKKPLYFVTQIQDITEHKRAEQAAFESQQLLQAVLNSIPVRVFWKDRNLVYLGCNVPFARDAGFESPEDLIGKDDYDTSWPELADRYRSDDRAVIESGTTKALFEEPLTTASGERIHLLTSKMPLRDGSGTIVGVLGTYHDITEHRRAQDALRKSEETHRALVAGLPDIVMRFDREGRHLFVSENVRETGVLEAWQLIGKTHREAGFPEPHCLLWETAIRRVFDSGTAFETEFGIEGKHGPAVHNLRLVPEHDETGMVHSVLALSRDITARRRAEDDYRMLFREMRDGLALQEIICDETGRPVDYRFLAVNPSFERLTGLKAEEIIGRTVREVLPGTEQSWIATYGEVALTGQPAMFESYTQPLGKYFEVRAFRPAPMQFACIFADITERKRAEEKNSALQAQLHQAQKMESIGRLAGGVAHDFNNLLTVINGYSHLLLSKLNENDPLWETIEAIHSAGERAAALTRQLLAFSRKQVLAPRRLNINRVVEEMRPMLERLVGEDIEVKTALHAEGGMVNADPHQLEQVIMNLVVNARDAMPGGGKLLLETAYVDLDEEYKRSHPETATGSFVRLAVSDTGVGMDNETKSRIFEPFFTTKDTAKGSGLGLSMVQGIVVQSGGHIEVYSEEGRGTTFKIYLPAITGAAARHSVPETAPALGRNETVLVVEDQAEVRKYATAVLRSYGYRVMSVENPDEALVICEKEKIDVVLTDVVMPHVSGRELANRLSKVQPATKVLFMSGYTDNVIVHHGMLEEGTNFIQKPFNPAELASKVRAVLESPKTESPACILVTDDDAAVRGLLRMVLKRVGYDVVEAADGHKALKQMRAQHVDLVTTDLVMPEQEGLDLIQTLRRDYPNVGIIAISGAFEGQFLETARLLGADATLAKPVDTELLVTQVADILKNRRR